MLRFVILAAAIVTASEAVTKDSKFIDLTYAFNNQTVLFPGRKPSFNVEFEGFTAAGFWVSSKGFCISEHTGTHIDAPYHFHQTGITLDQIPLDDLIDVPGVMIDVYDKVHIYKNGKLSLIQNYAMTREDIIEWERVNGAIPPRALVLLRSGWGRRWPDSVEYQGLEVNSTTPAPPNAPSKLDFDAKLNSPGFDASAAQYLTTERQVLGVGIDTLNIDIGSSKSFPAHVIFAARGAYMIENAANLHLLPPTGFNLWAIPFKIDKGTGAPIRLMAKLHTTQKNEL
jgi:kynurenine formamidase